MKRFLSTIVGLVAGMGSGLCQGIPGIEISKSTGLVSSDTQVVTVTPTTLQDLVVVRLYLNGQIHAQDYSSPYVFELSNQAADFYQVYAVANYDTGVGEYASAVKSYTVGEPSRSLSLAVAKNRSPGRVTLNCVGYSGLAGAIYDIDFYLNDNYLGTDSTSPATFEVLGLEEGAYRAQARVTYSNGDQFWTNTETFEIRLPKMKVTAKAQGGGKKRTVHCEAKINPSRVGEVQSVAFYINGSWVGTDSAPPFKLRARNVAAKRYRVTAVATLSNFDRVEGGTKRLKL